MGKRQGWPVSLLCSRNAAHGKRLYLHIAVGARSSAHVEAKRAAPERDEECEDVFPAAGARAKRTSRENDCYAIGGWVKKVAQGWVGEIDAHLAATRFLNSGRMKELNGKRVTSKIGRASYEAQI